MVFLRALRPRRSATSAGGRRPTSWAVFRPGRRPGCRPWKGTRRKRRKRDSQGWARPWRSGRPRLPAMAHEELKQRQSVMWGNGPYQRITETIPDIHDRGIERLALQLGDRWLDLACGTGAVAERAAAAGPHVTAGLPPPRRN